MSEPFMGEIRVMSFNFAPQGWALCNGQFLPINQNQALFSLLGTMYGGNGQTTFALPDLRGHVPIHVGHGHTQGERGGQEAHTVSISEMPTHTHVLNAVAADGTLVIPVDGMFAKAAPANPYHDPTNLAVMNAAVVTSVGGSQPHENLQPYAVLSFCIALQGVFPSRN
jgi:microcystin-dependent protein